MPSGVAGASQTITGEGSSFAGPAIQQWVGQVENFEGLSINYSISSSVYGLLAYSAATVNFAASEIGYSTGQANPLPSGAQVPYQYMPDVGGALCLMYNLRTPTGQQIGTAGGAPPLRLDAQTVLKIFSGQIQSWNDPEIEALNPSLAGALPNLPITGVVRSDASGENYILSDYFYTLYPSLWTAFTNAMGQPSGPQAIWPSVNGPGNVAPYNVTNQLYNASGSDTLASDVQGPSTGPDPNNGRIGYLETEYAIHYSMPCAQLENPSGTFVQPSEINDAVALTQDQLYPDLEQNLTNVFLNTNPSSYPISAYSYLISQEGQMSAPVGAALGQFVQYIACQGQQSAGSLGYTPIPPNLVADDFDAVNRMAGAAHLASPTASNCQNPYITGQLALPGEPIQLSTGPGASGGAAGTNPNAAGSANPGTTTAAGTSAAATLNSSSAGANTAAEQAAAVAAAAAKAAEVAAASKAKARSSQPPGLALVSSVGRLLAAPFSTGQIWVWSLLLIALFAILPAAIALAARRRGRTAPEGEKGP